MYRKNIEFEIKKKLNLKSNNFTKVTFISIETFVASFVTANLNVASQGKTVPHLGCIAYLKIMYIIIL